MACQNCFSTLKSSAFSSICIFLSKTPHLHNELPFPPSQQVLKDKEGQQEKEEDTPPLSVVDIPALDDIQSLVEDLYFATAHPRFDVDPARLRRQQQSASSAAGALTNAMGDIDRRTNQPSKPTDKVGDERTELLEFTARVMIRCTTLHTVYEAICLRA